MLVTLRRRPKVTSSRLGLYDNCKWLLTRFGISRGQPELKWMTVPHSKHLNEVALVVRPESRNRYLDDPLIDPAA